MSNRHWTEHFRTLTPLLLFVMSVIGSLIWYGVNINNQKLNDIDTKLFKHLTNDEMHCPRSIIVTRVEFDMYQKMRDKQMFDLKEGIYEIKCLLEKKLTK